MPDGTRLLAYARLIGVALAAGAVAGVYLGVVGRVAMRVIALAAGLSPGFSPGGTAEVVATGLIIGTPAALAYAMLRRRLPIVGRVRGAIFGALLLALLTAFPPPAARSAASGVGRLPLTLLVFAPVFVSYGVLVEVLHRRWTDRAAPPARPSGSVAG